MNKFRKLILYAGVGLLLFALYRSWDIYGPGWKRLTGKSQEWNVMIHEGGATTEYSTTFELDNLSDFTEFSFTCDGLREVTVFINEIPVAELNGFYIHGASVEENVVIHPYYKLMPHVLDSAVRWTMKEGINTLKLLVKTTPGKTVDVSHWGLDSHFEGFSLRLENTPDFEGRKWSASQRIPVMKLSIPGFCIPDEPKVAGLMSYESQDTILSGRQIKIEARGRSSIGFNQKSFSLRITDSNGKPAKIAFPGFSENSSFILYAPMMDLSLLRNVLAYDLSRGMGHYAPKSVPIELIINNHYRGLYYLMERIDVSTDRVPVRYSAGDENNPRNNGFLVELNPADPGDEILYTDYWNFILHRPGAMDIPEGKYRDLVAAQLNILVRSVYQQSDELETIIDFRSFADYIILQECSKNIDAYRLSTFFYKSHEDDDKLIHAGPVWDFNLAFGLSDEMGGRSPEGWIYPQSFHFAQFWTQLCEHPEFSEYLKNRYAELRLDLLSDSSLSDRIDSLAAQIEPVREHHFARYPWPSVPAWPYPEIHPDYKSETEAIKNFLRRRMEWLDEQWGNR